MVRRPAMRRGGAPLAARGDGNACSAATVLEITPGCLPAGSPRVEHGARACWKPVVRSGDLGECPRELDQLVAGGAADVAHLGPPGRDVLGEVFVG